MNYYEINFYGENDIRDYSWYIKHDRQLTNEQVKGVLIKDFLNHGITQDMLDNITIIRDVDANEFTVATGLQP